MKTTLSSLGELVRDYKYDQLHRIREANSLGNAYKEIFTYDANRNIQTNTLHDRNGTRVDNATYHYFAQTNKLHYISDTHGETQAGFDLMNQISGNFAYDLIGNLVKDKAMEVASMSWTAYHKREKVVKEDGTTITYRYDAMNNRIYKKAEGNGVTETTHYLRDGTGNTLAIYKNGVLEELNIYGSSRLGSYNGKTLEGKRTLGNKKYELSNHLGNVLSVISDNKIGIDNDTDLIADTYEPLVISESDYYPFGMAMKERSFSNEEYRFGFNTQEKSTELGEDTYTAEFWQYDSKIARRWNNDPRPNTSISVYAAFAGNPIWFSDHLGDTTRYYNSSGEKIGQINDELENAVTVITDDNLAAFTRDYKFFKSLDDDLQKNSENYFAHVLRGDGISYMTENLLSGLKAYSALDPKNIFFDHRKAAKYYSGSDVPLRDFATSDGFFLPYEQSTYTYINNHNEVRIITDCLKQGGDFHTTSDWGKDAPPIPGNLQYDYSLWTIYHTHPVPENRLGIPTLRFLTFKPNDGFLDKTTFSGVGSASDGDFDVGIYFSASNSPHNFSVIANWEKGGTLIFHRSEWKDPKNPRYGRKNTVEFKVNLYEK